MTIHTETAPASSNFGALKAASRIGELPLVIPLSSRLWIGFVWRWRVPLDQIASEPGLSETMQAQPRPKRPSVTGT